MLPTDAEIGQAALAYFKQPFMKMSDQWIGSEKIYRFELEQKVKKDGHTLSFVIQGKKYDVPLYYHEKRTNTGNFENDTDNYRNNYKKDNTMLLTFKFASLKWIGHVPNEEFDKAIKNIGLILEKPTCLQKRFKSDIYNGNRYCIIEKPNDINVIPESITVVDATKTYRVKITFKNQPKNCGRCMGRHVGICPQLEAFYKAKDEKEKMRQDGIIQTKIYTDSTFRLTETLGLKADVACMSGGGFGQVTQAAIDDPSGEDKSNIMIFGGPNDFKNEGFENENEYCQNIEIAIDKLIQHARTMKDKQFAVIRAYPTAEHVGVEDLTRITRREYLFRRVE